MLLIIAKKGRLSGIFAAENAGWGTFLIIRESSIDS
jgi:hypothetical protein